MCIEVWLRSFPTSLHDNNIHTYFPLAAWGSLSQFSAGRLGAGLNHEGTGLFSHMMPRPLTLTSELSKQMLMNDKGGTYTGNGVSLVCLSLFSCAI